MAENSSNNSIQNPTNSIQNSTNSAQIGYADQYFLGSGDHPEQQLGSHKFNGDNFLSWNRVIRMALGAKNKLCFVDGSCKRPATNDPDLQKWIRNDYMVQSWIINSMDKTISEGFLLQQSARQLYEEILERYGQSNAPQLFELHQKLTSIQQDSHSIVEYYSQLKRVWDEIQLLDAFPDCDCGALESCTCGLLKKVIAADQKQKLIQFLSGLNLDYASSRTNILSMDPLPTVNRAYYILLQVEKQNKLSEKQQVSSQISAFASMKQNFHLPPSSNPGVKREFKKFKVDKQDRKCTHYKKLGHTVDQCFKLTGVVPEWFNNLRSKQVGGSRMVANAYDMTTDNFMDDNPLDPANQSSKPEVKIDSTLVNAVYKEMMKMMKNQSATGETSTHSINFAGTILVSNAETLHSSSHLEWIVDTGATDHMICDKSLFLDFKVLPQPIKVGLPDGKLKLVTHVGTVQFTSNFKLSNVFLLPDFKHNLLSVGKLLDEHQLFAKFTPTSCFFHDLTTSQIKAVAVRKAGLYKFHTDFSASCSPSATCSALHTQVSLPSFAVCHSRLGHPSIHTMN
ncbi:uncharacterized protein LOC125495523 [Beta vulgaris subsp. vulgaris]|uniref:uncharacterized protein LOC125495523 n=1 Tax=Beta vulgaris subsp. vulgaris TaxID=3555 RepID=UPI002036BC5D|nr:uncharacterized protein LOC125495523 [Beta vulgaris subsp. vulgaris]